MAVQAPTQLNSLKDLTCQTGWQTCTAPQTPQMTMESSNQICTSSHFFVGQLLVDAIIRMRRHTFHENEGCSSLCILSSARQHAGWW